MSVSFCNFFFVSSSVFPLPKPKCLQMSDIKTRIYSCDKLLHSSHLFRSTTKPHEQRAKDDGRRSSHFPLKTTLFCIMSSHLIPSNALRHICFCDTAKLTIQLCCQLKKKRGGGIFNTKGMKICCREPRNPLRGRVYSQLHLL